jgi:hypothetical protein
MFRLTFDIVDTFAQNHNCAYQLYTVDTKLVFSSSPSCCLLVDVTEQSRYLQFSFNSLN